MTNEEIRLFCNELKQKFSESSTIVQVQSEYYSIQSCIKEPNKLYVFGDNTWRVGKGGQAVIRDLINVFGIATKVAPGVNNWDYFKDELNTLSVIFKDISNLVHICSHKRYKFLIFPKEGLGTGLSEMPTRAPESYKIMVQCLNEIFGTTYEHSVINAGGVLDPDKFKGFISGFGPEYNH